MEINNSLMYLIVVTALCLLLFFSLTIFKWVKLFSSGTRPIQVTLEQMEYPFQRRHDRALRRTFFGHGVRLRQYASQRHRLINSTISTLEELNKCGIKARTDTTVCCICLEEFNTSDPDILDEHNSECNHESSGGKQSRNRRGTVSRNGRNRVGNTFRVAYSEATALSLNGMRKNKNEGFRNRRSFTINSRDDIRGVHQLSNKRKLSITMETIDGLNKNSMETADTTQQGKEQVRKYIPDDLYSCVFEQRVENDQNVTIVDMSNDETDEEEEAENNTNDISSPNYFSLTPARNEAAVVERDQYPRQMYLDDASYVNIPGTISEDSVSMTSSYNPYDVMEPSNQTWSSNFQNILGLLPCGHIFHFECVFEWLKKSQNCPTCRHFLSMFSIKVVNNETFQKFVYLSNLKRISFIDNVPSQSKRRTCGEIRKRNYQRSISLL